MENILFTYMFTQCTLLVVGYSGFITLPIWVIWFPSLLILGFIGIGILLVVLYTIGCYLFN